MLLACSAWPGDTNRYPAGTPVWPVVWDNTAPTMARLRVSTAIVTARLAHRSRHAAVLTQVTAMRVKRGSSRQPRALISARAVTQAATPRGRATLHALAVAQQQVGGRRSPVQRRVTRSGYAVRWNTSLRHPLTQPTVYALHTKRVLRSSGNQSPPLRPAIASARLTLCVRQWSTSSAHPGLAATAYAPHSRSATTDSGRCRRRWPILAARRNLVAPSRTPLRMTCS